MAVETVPISEVSTDSDSKAPNSSEDSTTQLARIFLEDFVVTSLLRVGRPLKSTDLIASADGFTLPRGGLREGLEGSTLVVQHERGWELALRLSRKSLSREERSRQPLEGALEELLRHLGKPLPLPVVVREIALIRGAYPETVREGAANVLRTARFAIEISPDTWLHRGFALDTTLPNAGLIVRENHLRDLPEWELVESREWPAQEGSLAERAAAVLQAARRPLPRKLLGYILWRQTPDTFDSIELARTLGDRKQFYPMTGGYVTLQAQLTLLRATLTNWMRQIDTGAAEEIDVAAILRQRGQNGTAPRPLLAQEIDELKNEARKDNGQAVSIVQVLTETFEMKPDDARFEVTLQLLNDTLRDNPEFFPVGIGRFMLRESVPSYIGEVPDDLRPVTLSVHHPETDEPMDFEMSDEGLEGEAAAFVHDPAWEDINEEVEVKLPRRPAGETPTSTRLIILNHHHRSGTLKLRRMDEEFFNIQGPLTRINLLAADAAGTTEKVGAWASRESGLIYEVAEWYIPRTPESGGVLEFERDPGSDVIRVRIGEVDKPTLISDDRVEALEKLQEAAAFLSLFELLQKVMAEHHSGADITTLWAEVNVIRRTTKRLIASILSGYHCFYFKQRGPSQILWRFDSTKLDQGFKRNKRKYVRR